MFAEVHLVVMCIAFVWHALTSYATSPEGAAELADIQELHDHIDQPTPTSGQTGATGTTGPVGVQGRKV